MKTFTRKRPVLAFIIYTFVITWVMGVIAGIALGPLEAELGWENRPVSMFLFKFGPSLGGLYTAWLLSGKEGWRALLQKGIKWQAPTAVVLVALVLPAAIMLLLLLYWSPDHVSEILSPSALSVLIPTACIKIFLGGGFGEEFGWRGFMQPRLEIRYSPFTASMIVGFIWIFWHLPATVLGGNIGNPLIFALTLLGYSVILAWIYHKSGGSVLWAAIFHGWANALSNTYDQIIGEQIADIEIFLNTGYAVAIVLVAVFLLLFYGWELDSENSLFTGETEQA